MKAYKGSRGIAPLILTAVLDGARRSSSRPGRFIPGERTSVPIEQEAGRVLKSGGFWKRENLLPF